MPVVRVQECRLFLSCLGGLPKVEGTCRRSENGGRSCRDLSLTQEPVAVVCFLGGGTRAQHHHPNQLFTVPTHLDITEP